MHKFEIFLVFLLFLNGIMNSSKAQTIYLGYTGPGFNEKIGLAYTQLSTQALAYNVTAVAQSDSHGFGPAYLINGVTAQGYWYQLGLAYDWTTVANESIKGFSVLYDVFAPNGTVIYPSPNRGGNISMSGPIYNGDKVMLQMSFNGSNMTMHVRDWDTNATGKLVLNAIGDDHFVGTPESNCIRVCDWFTTDPNGFFTGLMTEWYHLDLYHALGKETSYSPVGYAPSGNVIVWAGEFCLTECGYSQYAYSYQSLSYYYTNLYFYRNSTQFSSSSSYSFSSHNATAQFYPNGTFTTGSLPSIARLRIEKSNLPPITTDINNPKLVNYSVSISGGFPPYSYSSYLNSHQYPSSISMSTTYNGNISTSPSWMFNLGSNPYQIQIVDSIGDTVNTAEQQILINPQLKVHVANSISVMDQNQTLILQNLGLNITGGTSPFTLILNLNGQQFSDKAIIALTKIGPNYLAITVKGADNSTSSTNLTINVNPRPILSLTLSKNILSQNEKLPIKINVSGGTPPYTYSMYIDNNKVNYSDAISFNKTGNHTVTMAVLDAQGISSSKTFNVSVETDYIPFLVVFAILFILMSYFFLRKRKGQSKNTRQKQPRSKARTPKAL